MMCHGTHRIAVVLATLTLGVANFGCAAFEAKTLSTMHEATLDEARTVRLAAYAQHNVVLRGPEHNFAELSLVISYDAKTSKKSVYESGVRLPGGFTICVINRRGGEDGNSLERFKFGQLEARSNTTRDKLWIVDVEDSRVVVTLDLKTFATTGPDDEPPPWATLAGGVRLEPVAPD